MFEYTGPPLTENWYDPVPPIAIILSIDPLLNPKHCTCENIVLSIYSESGCESDTVSVSKHPLKSSTVIT